MNWTILNRFEMESVARNFECAGEAGHFFNAVASAPGFKAASETFDSPGIGVAGGSNLDCSCARKQELDGIFWGDDTAHSKDRDSNSVRSLVDHAQSNWLDGRPGQAAGDVTEAWPAGFSIDGEGKKCVGQADRIRTRLGRDARHMGDGSDVGREFNEEGAGRGGLGAADQIF